MIHTVLIVAHAAAAAVAFAFGCSLIVALPSARSARLGAFRSATWVMALLLLAVVIVDWAELGVVQRVVYSGLTILAGYMVWRASHGARDLNQPGGSRSHAISDIGFVLISLFDGFCIVATIDLGLPPVVVILAGVAGVVLGISGMGVANRREVRREASRRSF